jgi:hypothetical protein
MIIANGNFAFARASFAKLKAKFGVARGKFAQRLASFAKIMAQLAKRWADLPNGRLIFPISYRRPTLDTDLPHIATVRVCLSRGQVAPIDSSARR